MSHILCFILFKQTKIEVFIKLQKFYSTTHFNWFYNSGYGQYCIVLGHITFCFLLNIGYSIQMSLWLQIKLFGLLSIGLCSRYLPPTPSVPPVMRINERGDLSAVGQKLLLSAALWIPLGWGKVKGVQSPTPNCTGARVPLGRRGFSHSSLLGLLDYSCTFLLTPAAH